MLETGANSMDAERTGTPAARRAAARDDPGGTEPGARAQDCRSGTRRFFRGRGAPLAGAGVGAQPALHRRRQRSIRARWHLRAGRPDRGGQDHHRRQARRVLRGPARRRLARTDQLGPLPDRRPGSAAHLRQHSRRGGARGARAESLGRRSMPCPKAVGDHRLIGVDSATACRRAEGAVRSEKISRVLLLAASQPKRSKKCSPTRNRLAGAILTKTDEAVSLARARLRHPPSPELSHHQRAKVLKTSTSKAA